MFSASSITGGSNLPPIDDLKASPQFFFFNSTRSNLNRIRFAFLAFLSRVLKVIINKLYLRRRAITLNNQNQNVILGCLVIYELQCPLLRYHHDLTMVRIPPSGHISFIQRRIYVDATSLRCINFNATLNKRHVLAGPNNNDIERVCPQANDDKSA